VAAAVDADRAGRVPWSGDWTVAACAQHVGGAHHVVAGVIEGRPTADFGLFSSLAIPGVADPGLGAWLSGGTAALVGQLRAAAGDAECWSWWPEGRTANFWRRRMAHETLVHRWDAELGAGIVGDPMEPTLAADGIDEYLDVIVGMTRVLHSAPVGPPVGLRCTDTDGEWLLDLSAPGERRARRGESRGDVTLVGPAEGLLLWVWGRLESDTGGVTAVGDRTVLDNWTELVPPL